ncbi:MAG: dTDP-4-dehydrorhamnose reductase [Chloroflexi bacterium]|nr:dTDP-4-dehydrorhamnose reductase [Chloroflexota bacterium]MCI0856910.1 dTDP-4-dehydrorhamnose reductase [Chloroflexota bacterium]
MRTLLIGSKGQLGSDLIDGWSGDLVAFSHEEFDVCNRDQAHEIIAREQPALVINTAAYHRVDDCETNGARAFEVNALGAKNVADAAREAGAAVMFISTDYVQDGLKGSPYVEDDLPRPLSLYGASKLAGEHLVRQSNAQHYVVRSSSLFGVAGASGKGGNFVETMIRKARAGDPLRVVDDQVSSPTFTADLALKLTELANSGRYGLYQITNGGQTSWFGFAEKIFELMGLTPSLAPISSDELDAPARRPAFSVLENRALVEAGLEKLRSWEEALAAYLTAKGHVTPA